MSIQILEQSGKNTTLSFVIGQFLEIRYASTPEQMGNFCIHRIHLLKIEFQFVCKQSQWLITGIQLYRLFNIPRHGMWASVITNRTERLFRTEQTVCTRKSLNDTFKFHQLVQIQCIDPFGIKTCQHLIDNDQQIYLPVWSETKIKIIEYGDDLDYLRKKYGYDTRIRVLNYTAFPDESV